MASSDKKIQPIIVKKIKKGGHGHHGGAWKIAYADFVTAMMAFFLLMWLLGSTTKGDLKGISDYFASPLKVAFSGGSGSGDSNSILKGGGKDLTKSVGQVKRGEAARTRKTSVPTGGQQARAIEGKRLRALRGRIMAAIEGNGRLKGTRSQIRMDFTTDGLRIQIVDDQRRPMFDSGGITVKSYMRELLQEIGAVLNEVPNHVTLTGHTDAMPYGGGQRGYSNWELSADRANASRRELIAGGMNEDKVIRVEGMGSTQLFDKSDPRGPVNRRISIIVMTGEASNRVMNGPDALAERETPQTRDPDSNGAPAVSGSGLDRAAAQQPKEHQ
ncbi:MAG: flagellar motor protein MotB [Burkholderiaceae bacterium]